MMSAALTPGMAALVLFGIFFGLMFLRVPVAFALGLACVPIFIVEDRFDLQNLIQETFNAYNSFILLAVPFFLLTANLMNSGGITDRLVRFSRALVGHFHHDRTIDVAGGVPVIVAPAWLDHRRILVVGDGGALVSVRPEV